MPGRILILVAALCALAACSRTSPVSPTISSSSPVIVTSNGDSSMFVSGRVYSGSSVSDAPLSDADVVLTTGSSTTSARTGSSGEYSLAVPAGAATITASKRGYQSKTWAIEVANNLVVNFSLASQ